MEKVNFRKGEKEMECIEAFLREYRSEEKAPTEDLGFYLVSNEEIEEFKLSKEEAGEFELSTEEVVELISQELLSPV